MDLTGNSPSRVDPKQNCESCKINHNIYITLQPKKFPKMKSKSFPFVVVLFLIVGVLQAQQSQEPKSNNIFEALSTGDSTSHVAVKVHQDKRIEQLLANRKHSSSQELSLVSGYRVQVFSSNVQRTAKADAFRIEKQIKDELPDEAIYVNYQSPFWKVRVGDFRTQAEALKVKNQLKEAFPNLRSEIYIVREQVQLSGSK